MTPQELVAGAMLDRNQQANRLGIPQQMGAFANSLGMVPTPQQEALQDPIIGPETYGIGNLAKKAFPSAIGLGMAASNNINPMKLYHGTKGDFPAFDLKNAGASDPGLVGKAVYFTPTKEQADQFAKEAFYGSRKGGTPRTIEADVELSNPLIIQDGKLPDGRTLSQLHPNGISKESALAINNELINNGHDGVIFKLGDDVTQVAVFDPSKSVKSMK
jgi:hypothetical protein